VVPESFAYALPDGFTDEEAAPLDLRPTVTTYAFDAADRALDDLAQGRFTGTAALRMS
jgi:D-arabinose 1-dehydrogenase-like Zn-dependent alcohol dehydrogenase